MNNKILQRIETMLVYLLNPISGESLERLQLKQIIIHNLDLNKLEITIDKNIAAQELVLSDNNIDIIYFLRGKRKYFLPNIEDKILENKKSILISKQEFDNSLFISTQVLIEIVLDIIKNPISIRFAKSALYDVDLDIFYDTNNMIVKQQNNIILSAVNR
jgi:hypothetical protein